MNEAKFRIVLTPLGHKVKIEKETWQNHIIVQHPEMIGKVEDVLNVLNSPDFIAFSRKYSTYNVFFENIMVAYKLVDRINGIVLTAMKVKKTYKEKLRKFQIWP